MFECDDWIFVNINYKFFCIVVMVLGCVFIGLELSCLEEYVDVVINYIIDFMYVCQVVDIMCLWFCFFFVNCFFEIRKLNECFV